MKFFSFPLVLCLLSIKFSLVYSSHGEIDSAKFGFNVFEFLSEVCLGEEKGLNVLSGEEDNLIIPNLLDSQVSARSIEPEEAEKVEEPVIPENSRQIQDSSIAHIKRTSSLKIKRASKAQPVDPKTLASKSSASSTQGGRDRVYNLLLDKYNHFRNENGLGNGKKIKWSCIDTPGWPEQVKCRTPRGWGPDDIQLLEQSLPQISFAFLPRRVNPLMRGCGLRLKVNHALHSEILDKAQELDLAINAGIDWRKVHAKFPTFMLSNRDFRNWSQTERENLKKLSGMMDEEIEKLSQNRHK